MLRKVTQAFSLSTGCVSGVLPSSQTLLAKSSAAALHEEDTLIKKDTAHRAVMEAMPGQSRFCSITLTSCSLLTLYVLHISCSCKSLESMLLLHFQSLVPAPHVQKTHMPQSPVPQSCVHQALVPHLRVHCLLAPQSYVPAFEVML